MDDGEVSHLEDMDVDGMEEIGVLDQHVMDQMGNQREPEEWVMVDEMDSDTAQEAPPTEGQPQTIPTKPTTDSPAAAAVPEFANTPTGSGKQGLTPAAPAGDEAGMTQEVSAGDFDLGQEGFDANLDDNGDGLVDFGDDHGDLNLEGMDDSAFGDAFHPPDEGQGNLPEQGDMS